MLECDIADKLHDKNGFTYTCTTEKTDLSAACIRCHEIDYLNSRFENFVGGNDIGKCGRGMVDRPYLFRLDIAAPVDRVSRYIDHSA